MTAREAHRAPFPLRKLWIIAELEPAEPSAGLWPRSRCAWTGHSGRQGYTRMNQPLGILGTPHVGFFALIIIGGLAGWIAGMILGSRHWIFTNILIGICGSWIGSQLADIAHIGVYGSLAHFVAALVGSLVILYGYQLLHPKTA